jgi:hypothetical protein
VNNKSSGDDDDDQFAAVVRDLSGGPWSLGRKRTWWETSSASRQPVAEEEQTLPLQAVADEWSQPVAPASVVRPYTWTRGRTSPVFDLAVETLVSSSEHGHDVAVLTSEEHRAVAELCRDPRSVAEVAALLSLPLGVARVLLADMANIGLIVVHRSANSSGDRPDTALMERVLSGLRRL